MKRKLTTLLVTIFAAGLYAQSGTDTLYYDKEWKGVEGKAFANFYRVIPKSGDPNFRKPLRDYYITGELQEEGYFLTVDKYDDKNSVFTGDFTCYYKNGKVAEKGTHSETGLQGEYISYREDGLVNKKATFKDGKPDGLLTQFSEDGNLCYQWEYANGEPLYDWYMVSDANGNCSKIKSSDNTPIYESPELSEKKVEYQNGEAWPYYNKNGIMVGTTNNQVRDYGKWYKIPIVIANNSMVPIDFDPDAIKAVLIDKKGNEVELKVYSANEYMKKVRKSQNWSMALLGIAEGLAAVDAGYSVSHTHSSYSGNSHSRDSRGHVSNSSYGGSSVSTTTTYNALAAYQAAVIACDRMVQYEDALLSQRKAREEGYLKLTTINPGETISGYVNVKRKKGQTLTVYVDINGAIYTFPWNVQK